jgi:hypothetical protein
LVSSSSWRPVVVVAARVHTSGIIIKTGLHEAAKR